MKSLVFALLLTMSAQCLAQAQRAPVGLVDERPIDERKSQFVLESYRTQITLADDSMEPSPIGVFEQAIRSAIGSQRTSMVIKSLSLRVSIPPAVTSAEVYQAMNLPDGPPNAPSLTKAISSSLSIHPGTAALVVCEAEVLVGDNEFRALVRESYDRNLTPQVLVALLQQAAAELVADVKTAK